MKQVYQHISDPPTLRNQGAENLRIECVGSPIGRFIFTDWAPMVRIDTGRGLLFKNCHFCGVGA